jgi:hypothetical protein
MTDSRDESPIVTREADDTGVWVGGCMRSEGLEYSEYLYVQRETREEVGGVNRGGGGHRESGTLHDPIRGETAVGCGRPRAGGGEFYGKTVVTDPTTNPALRSLTMGERTGSRIFYELSQYIHRIGPWGDQRLAWRERK